jgi:hypothetical protein
MWVKAFQNTKDKLHKTINLLVILYGCERVFCFEGGTKNTSVSKQNPLDLRGIKKWVSSDITK